MTRRIRLILLTICIVCAGCKTISKSTINVNLDTSECNVRTLAVMHFDDTLIRDETVKGFVMKTINNPDGGEILANVMTEELFHWKKYHVLTRSEVRGRIRAGNSKEEELAKEKDYTRLGKILKVDAVVVGKIHAFGISNMTVYERGKVSFTAECIDIKKGKVLWSMETNESAPYKDEVDLAVKVVKEVVEKLKRESE